MNEINFTPSITNYQPLNTRATPIKALYITIYNRKKESIPHLTRGKNHKTNLEDPTSSVNI